MSILPSARSRLNALTLVLAAVVIVGLGFIIPTPYILKAPGPTEDLSRVVEVEGGQRNFAGKFLMVTAISQKASLVLYVYGLLDPRAELVLPQEDKAVPLPSPNMLPRTTQQSAVMAEVAAFHLLGYPTYLGADRRHGRTFLAARGLPHTVKIDASQFEGPSAGLMFALEIIRQTTGNDITRGDTIAGTGTLNAAGQVGPIRGIQYKIEAARRSGATLFLAPEENYREIRGMPSPVRADPIKTLADAVSTLRHQAGPRTASTSSGLKRPAEWP